MTPDLINSFFELGAGFVLILNVIKIYKDKQLKGVCITPAVFMAAWGLYGLYFYWQLDTPFSFACCIPIAIINVVWVCQMFYYRKKKNV